MRIELDKQGRLKQWIYIASSGVLFITWVLSLAALTQKGGVDGRLGWVFGLCFLTIPLLIYQSLTPTWSRTARFSHPTAHSTLDILLVLLWSSAWISLASYVLSGKGKGDIPDATGCGNFAHGSASKCQISEADIVFCVVLSLCFVGSSWFSFGGLMEYRRRGVSPATAYAGTGKQEGGTGYKETEDDEAFDSRLDVESHGRESGYGHSLEDARVQGGAPTMNGGYGGLGVLQPYGGYESVPNPGGEGETEYSGGRPTSFGGPLGGSRL